MNRKLKNNRTVKHAMLAVPAAALMLGAAQGGSTVGLNFQAWYYDSGNTPQTTGYGAGYQTTGFPVTGRAFGVAPGNWSSSDPITCGHYGGTPLVSSVVTFGGTATTFAGGLSASVSAPNAWQSGIGETVAGWNSEVVPPGNCEVTWGYLDDGNSNGQSPSASVSGLAAKFPNGYVVMTIAAENGKGVTFDGVDITDDSTTNTVTYSTYYVASAASDGYDVGGTVGVSGQSGKFTADTININSHPKTSGSRSTLAAFIITDQPVVTLDPVGASVNTGTGFILSAQAIGIPPLTYQWQHAGTNLPGATNLSYTNSAAGSAAAGDYVLVASNAYGTGSSVPATVNVFLVPVITTDLPAAATNYLTMNETWSVVAGGQQPLYYQWTHGGAPIAGATTSSLTLPSIQAGDAGQYQVVITNAIGAATSQAVSLAVISSLPPYDGFNYAAGPLLGGNAGVGWLGGWSQSATYNGQNDVIQPGAAYLDPSNQLITSPGAVSLAAEGSADFENVRSLICDLGGNGTIYISFVGQVTNTGWAEIELLENGNTSFGMGSTWYANNWGWGDRGNFNANNQVSSTPSSRLSLLVYRFDFSPTGTAVRLYVNPALESEPTTPSAVGTWSSFVFNQVRLVAHGPTSPNGIIDEFRIGGSWASAVPFTPRTDPPTITRDLGDLPTPVYTGEVPGNLWVAVSGALPLHYQWTHAGTNVPGGTNATLILPPVTAAAAGYYMVTITNQYGFAESQADLLEVVTPDTYSTTVLADGPKNLWPLSETNGGLALDYIAADNGTQNGTIAVGQPGPQAPAYPGFFPSTLAYNFDGGSGYLALGAAPALAGTTDFAVEAWIQPVPTGATEMIIQQRYSGGYNGEFQFAINPAGNLSFDVYGNGGYQFQIAATNVNSLMDGNWHHVAAVRSGTNGLVYQDGLAVGGGTGPLAPLDPTFLMYIGADMRDGVSFFGGYMADVALYGYVLSASQVRTHALVGVNGALKLTVSGHSLIWSGSGTLLSSPVLGSAAVWTPVPGATSPYAMPASGPRFYRLVFR